MSKIYFSMECQECEHKVEGERDGILVFVQDGDKTETIIHHISYFVILQCIQDLLEHIIDQGQDMPIPITNLLTTSHKLLTAAIEFIEMVKTGGDND